MNEKRWLLSKSAVDVLPEERRPHPLDSSIVRYTRSLGDASGLQTIGVHLVRLPHGHTSSVQHTHHQDEEWIYILSGRGIANIGERQHEVGPGDFMGFPAGSPAHNLHNPHRQELVYLVGGNRWPFDVCDYPGIGKRRYRVNGKNAYVDENVLAQAGEELAGKVGGESRPLPPPNVSSGEKGDQPLLGE